ncbi:MAG: hypothetical protein IKE81_10420 [Clostridia bacterium]|jgi:hypothetical protein|nr:hypothetical protein [Clostridia bacterium]
MTKSKRVSLAVKINIMIMALVFNRFRTADIDQRKHLSESGFPAVLP